MSKVPNPLRKPGDYFLVPDDVARTPVIVKRQTNRTRVSLGTPKDDPKPPSSGSFLSYPRADQRTIDGGTDVLIERLSFVGTTAGRSAIILRNIRRGLVRLVDFADVPGCIYAVDCEDIVIEDCRARNILGPAHDAAGNRTDNIANLSQYNRVVRGAVRRVKVKGGDTEDVISVYQSHDIVVEDNQIEGGTWSSDSGSGIALGDDGGSGNIARRNRLLNPGQVGIFIAGGTDCRIEDNVIYGRPPRGAGQVGIYVWRQGGGECSGHTVARNVVDFIKSTGEPSGGWDGENCGAITGWSSNDWDAMVDPASLVVTL